MCVGWDGVFFFSSNRLPQGPRLKKRPVLALGLCSFDHHSSSGTTAGTCSRIVLLQTALDTIKSKAIVSVAIWIDVQLYETSDLRLDSVALET